MKSNYLEKGFLSIWNWSASVVLFKCDTISCCVPSFVVKIDFRLLIMNWKPGGFLKLADGLDLVFGAVNSPVVQHPIKGFSNLTNNSNYRTSCGVIVFWTGAKQHSFRQAGVLRYLYGNCTMILIHCGSGFVKLWQDLIKNRNVDSYITCIMSFRREYPTEFETKEWHLGRF